MMHLEAIIERNKRPAPQPHMHETDYVVNEARRAVELATRNRRPWDKPDPMPESEAHPR